MSTPVKKQSSAPKTSAERMREHRLRMRERGFVQKTIWVPDLSNPDILARYHRAGEAIASSDPASDDIQEFMDAALEDLLKDEPPYDWGGEPPTGFNEK
jgi:hypothetical protein